MADAPQVKPFRRDVRNLTGQKFGLLRVLALVGRKKFPKGGQQTIYSVYCTGCGQTSEMTRTGIVKAQGCHLCCKERARRCHIRIDATGETLSDIAARAGLKPDTVYARYKRGWPLAKLGAPLRPQGGAYRAYGRTSKHAR